MNNVNLLYQRKEPKYVGVYNKLFKMINEESFPEDSRLPSEPELAKNLGVSRTTLRQALSLLIDDGLIKNIRGKGNFITNTKKTKDSGLETLGNVIEKCLDVDITDIDINFRIENTSEYFKKILNSTCDRTLCVERYFKSGSEIFAYSFTIAPCDIIDTFGLSIENKDSILDFLNNEVYNICSNNDLNIKFSSTKSFIKNIKSAENKFYLIEESIFNNSKSPMVFIKNYLPMEYSTLNFKIKKW